MGLLLALWCLIGVPVLLLDFRRNGWKRFEFFTTSGVWLVVAIALFIAPELGIANHAIPVYGYGMMLFVGFAASAWFAAWRIRREGGDGEIAWDAAIWIFVSGIVGSRLFYVVQYADRFFGPDPANGQRPSIGQMLKAIVNLPDGGLVLYGGLLIAPLAYYLFCRRRRVSPLALGDIVISSMFLGLLFGRLGCFLHGCCFGDQCDLPWAVSFPAHSVPFEALVSRGYLSQDALRSLPLHPTQLYDSLNGLLLLLVTWAYYPFRRRTGEVLAIGWMAYPVNRFLIEILRGDESGKFGTALTISQWVSLALFAAGAAFFGWLQTRPPGRTPLQVTPDAGLASARPSRVPPRVDAPQAARI
ncbi:MAG: prolipoprotein diacylglyceryl transferase [Planctomycetaceae bacterium]|nr:prolipoprotein diacylglyceryl transferase [Planctomycetaceae bacterium]